jgi:methionyl-tRNA synthetase
MRILITSALLYANGMPHFGHLAGAYLPADAYARFQRLQGHDVLLLSGSDEYGVAITLAAELAAQKPKEFVDHYYRQHKRLFERLGFSYDYWARTSWEGHGQLAQQFFTQLLANGHIEERVTQQLYDPTAGRFLADRYVVGICPRCQFEPARGDECPSCGTSYDASELGNPRSKLTGAPLETRATTHWFLCFDKLQERLTAWLAQKDWKPNVLAFARHYLEHLIARPITRDLEWGVPVPLPNAQGKVLYVWFDAPIGYISATQEWAQSIGQPERWKDYWLDPETRLVQFIGKDNIPFHSVLFPAMILGQNQPYKLVDQLPANEFLMLEGRQFSKSDNWTIDLEKFLTQFHPDQLRYALIANAPESADSEFTWADFAMRCNTELVGKWANLVHRTLTFVQAQCGGRVPPRHTLESIDRQYLEKIRQRMAAIANHFEGFHQRKAAQELMELASDGNVYFDHKQPWKDAKAWREARSDLARQRMETTLSCCLEGLQLLAIASSPIMPTTAAKLWSLLGEEKLMDRWTADPLTEGKPLPAPEPLFQRVDEALIQSQRAQLGQAQTTPSELVDPPKPEVGIEAVDQLDLRVARIKAAKPVPKSKKLLELTVDLGTEERTIVSGIASGYQPEQLIGRSVVIVANLRPAKLMGIESQGMLLAARSGQLLEILEMRQVPPGSTVS